MKKYFPHIFIVLIIAAAIGGMFWGHYLAHRYDNTPKRYLLEMGYNTKTIDLKNGLQRIGKDYTIDAIYTEGKDTIKVKGITQAQYDSLHIIE